LTTLQTFSPQVAILDIGLPGMSGYELAGRLRDTMASPVALIALTGYGQPADRKQAENAGFDLHLVKPVDTAALLAAVQQLLRPGAGTTTA